jgi:pSer/pThr/pTyr-binding forkhead associated (FHA) protein/CheY-like chemotaxis protein
MASLQIHLPDSSTISHELSGQDVVSIGWGPDNSVQIKDSSISRRHAQIIQVDGRYRLIDLDSTNKSWLNGEPVSDSELKDTDKIRFGNVECVFTQNGSGENQSAQRESNTLARLVVVIPGKEEESFRLAQELITIGWKSDNHIRIKEPSISGHHASLRFVDGSYHLKDLDSTNKTFVNGKLITECILKDGDDISFGAVSATFKADMQLPVIPKNGVYALLKRHQGSILPLQKDPNEQKRATMQIRPDAKPSQEQVKETTAEPAKTQTAPLSAETVATLQNERDEARKAAAAMAAELGELKKTAKDREHLAEQLSKAAAETSALISERDAAVESSKAVTQRLTEVFAKMDALTQANEVSQGTIAEISEKLKRTQSTAETLEAERAKLQHTKEQIAARLQDAEDRVESLQKEAEVRGNAFVTESSSLAEMQQKLAALQREHELSTQTKDIICNKLIDAESRIEYLRAELDVKQEESKKQIADLNQEIDSLKSSQTNLNQQLQEARDENTKLKDDLPTSISELKILQSRIIDLEANTSDLSTKLHAVTAERDVAQQYVTEISSKMEHELKINEGLRKNLAEAHDANARMLAEIADLKSRLERGELALAKRTDESAKEAERLSVDLIEAKNNIERVNYLYGETLKLSEQQTHQIEQAQNRIGSLEETINSLNRTLSGIEQERAANASAQGDLLSKLKISEGRVEALNAEIDNLLLINQEAFTKIAEAHSELGELQQKSTSEAQASAKAGSANVAEFEFRVQTLEIQIRELSQERESLISEKVALAAQLQELLEKQKAAEVKNTPAPAPGMPVFPDTQPHFARETSQTPFFTPNQPNSTPAFNQRDQEDSQKEPAAVSAASADLMIRDQTIIKLPKPVTRGRGRNENSTTVKIEVNPALLSQIIEQAPEALNGMRRCLHAFIKNQSENTLLIDLHKDLHQLSEQTSKANLKAAHTMTFAIEGLIDDLMRMPGQINPSTLRTVSQSLDFLATLLEQDNLTKLKDPFLSNIFAVDDDSEARKIIRSAMETVNLKITCAEDPKTTLMVLNEQRFDLIFIDVGLPEMTGFDLCTQIRKLSDHKKTPIVFLTGAVTVQNRVQSSLSGGNDFIAKPFNIMELGVKALTWIFKGQLGQV